MSFNPLSLQYPQSSSPGRVTHSLQSRISLLPQSYTCTTRWQRTHIDTKTFGNQKSRGNVVRMQETTATHGHLQLNDMQAFICTDIPPTHLLSCSDYPICILGCLEGKSEFELPIQQVYFQTADK